MTCKALYNLGNVYFSECLSYYSPFHSLYLSHTVLLLLGEDMDQILLQMLHLMFPILVTHITIKIHMVHVLLSFRPEMLTPQRGPPCPTYLRIC